MPAKEKVREIKTFRHPQNPRETITGILLGEGDVTDEQTFVSALNGTWQNVQAIHGKVPENSPFLWVKKFFMNDPKAVPLNQ
ncbi:MAG: hypothetical protein KGH93_01635 [Patescibacteria group bacterium]|nr:hypothetical protein [Patescibacteria group bacterium]MDE1945883.1 hypothetical protein [Patescibacteria group bacterium]